MAKGKMGPSHQKGGVEGMKGAAMGMGGGKGAEPMKGCGDMFKEAAGNSGFSFTFSDDESSVLTLSRTNASGTASKTLDITNSTFVTTVGTNDLGSSAVVSVTETQTATSAVITRTYSDQDGDGLYSETLDVKVASATDARALQHQFTFGTDDSISTDALVTLRGLRTDVITSNEVYAKVVLGEDTYVTKTTNLNGNYVFEMFRDDNADGNWTSVARGHSSGTSIDANGAIELTGIQTLLTTSEALIG